MFEDLELEIFRDRHVTMAKSETELYCKFFVFYLIVQ